MSTILLRLKGPLQSWGTSSHFDTRHTDYYPSKSGVIGIIAASMGYRRDEDEKIRRLNELEFAVRIDRQGMLAIDFHSARKFKSDGTIDQAKSYITNRYYLEDAIFTAAISHSDESFMNEIEQGLKNPYFQPFMGRRSCPLPMDFFIGKFQGGVTDNLKNSDGSIIYADAHLIEGGAIKYRKDNVLSFSQKERKFQYRGEKNLRENEHDAFSAVGD